MFQSSRNKKKIDIDNNKKHNKSLFDCQSPLYELVVCIVAFKGLPSSVPNNKISPLSNISLVSTTFKAVFKLAQVLLSTESQREIKF